MIKPVKLIFEYIEGQSLDKFLEKVDLFQIIKISKDLAEALKVLHSFGFVHADFKPENILITTNMQVKIIDFGIS